MSKEAVPTRYTLAYENGELIKRAKKHIGGREVTCYTNYTKLPRDVRSQVTFRLLAEVAKTTDSDPESVRLKLLDNYNAACKTASDNAYRGMYEPVLVEPITYTVDRRRRSIQIEKAPILTSLN